MTFKLPDLPYPMHALEPHVSRRTMEFHHGKHHQTYVKKLNDLVEGKQYARLELEGIIVKSAAKADERAIFNNAAQTWNHTFFWNSMRPEGGGKPDGDLAKRIDKAFGGFDGFRQTFIDTAVGQFGSGWAWLIADGEKLKVIGTPNAENPLPAGQVPLLTCDVWEHAYYLDYQNRRNEFVEIFLDRLANWEHAAAQLAAGGARAAAEASGAGRR